jgi:uncharacterized protein YciI
VFVGIYTRGAHWLEDKAVREQPLEGHFAYMERLQNRGELILGGPFKDDTGALAVIEAASLDEARAVFFGDPAVSEGTFAVVVHPWFVSVAGCVDTKPW